jgi:hypothetical protein
MQKSVSHPVGIEFLNPDGATTTSIAVNDGSMTGSSLP